MVKVPLSPGELSLVPLTVMPAMVKLYVVFGSIPEMLYETVSPGPAVFGDSTKCAVGQADAEAVNARHDAIAIKNARPSLDPINSPSRSSPGT